MIRYFSAKALEHKYSQNPNFYDSTLKKLSEVKDMAELYQIAVEFKQLLIENVDKLEEKEFAQNLHFTAKTVNGVIESFKIEETKPIVISFAGDIEIRMAAMTLNEKSMSTGFVIATALKNEVFNQYVQQCTIFLTELQGRNEKYLKHIEDSASGYMELVRDFLTQ